MEGKSAYLPLRLSWASRHPIKFTPLACTLACGRERRREMVRPWIREALPYSVTAAVLLIVGGLYKPDRWSRRSISSPNPAVNVAATVPQYAGFFGNATMPPASALLDNEPNQHRRRRVKASAGRTRTETAKTSPARHVELRRRSVRTQRARAYGERAIKVDPEVRDHGEIIPPRSSSHTGIAKAE